MKRFERLQKLNSWLAAFQVNGASVIRCTNQGDATTKLSDAVGNQVVIARPECFQQGESTDVYNDTLSLAFFVLSKDLGSAATYAEEDEKYAELLELSNSVVSALEESLTSGDCGYLAGFDLSSVNIVPELSLFGGWFGYSIDITLS